MATTVILGNTDVIESRQDPETGETQRTPMPRLGNQVTTVEFPDNTDGHAEIQLAQIVDLWPYHSDADGPEWVETDDDLLGQLIARRFTTDTHKCQVGRPKGWKEGASS